MLFDQVFALSDLPRVASLCFIEILLSADNAVVLGVLTQTFPKHLRNKALLIGISSAFFFRIIAILTLSVFLKLPWVEALGGLYLIYLSVRYFFKTKKRAQYKRSFSFWQTIFLIELLDLVFAIDSIVAGLAFIENARPKLWIVYLGGMIGLIGIRYAARLFSYGMERFPKLEASAYLMVGLIGLKLIFAILGAPIPSFVFWPAICLLFLFGFFGKIRL